MLAVFVVSIASCAELDSHTLHHHLNHHLDHDRTDSRQQQRGSQSVQGHHEFVYFWTAMLVYAHSRHSNLETQVDQLGQGHHLCRLCHLFQVALEGFGSCCSYWLHSARHSYQHKKTAGGQLALWASSWNRVDFCSAFAFIPDLELQLYNYINKRTYSSDHAFYYVWWWINYCFAHVWEDSAR